MTPAFPELARAGEKHGDAGAINYILLHVGSTGDVLEGGTVRRRHIDFGGLDQENAFLSQWESSTADTRLHATTRQQVSQLFREVEQRALQKLPAEPFPFLRSPISKDSHPLRCPRGPETTRPPSELRHAGACAPRRTLDPAIPCSVASPQSRTPLHRTSALYQKTGDDDWQALDTFRGSYCDPRRGSTQDRRPAHLCSVGPLVLSALPLRGINRLPANPRMRRRSMASPHPVFCLAKRHAQARRHDIRPLHSRNTV